MLAQVVGIGLLVLAAAVVVELRSIAKRAHPRAGYRALLAELTTPRRVLSVAANVAMAVIVIVALASSFGTDALARIVVPPWLGWLAGRGLVP